MHLYSTVFCAVGKTSADVTETDMFIVVRAFLRFTNYQKPTNALIRLVLL
jgi:hypothetical protein